MSRLGLEKAAPGEAQRLDQPGESATDDYRTMRSRNEIGSALLCESSRAQFLDDGNSGVHISLPMRGDAPCDRRIDDEASWCRSADPQLRRTERRLGSSVGPAWHMSCQSPEVLLCTQGTRGDLAPFLGLAARLISAGRRVTILANENWSAAVHAVGADFRAIGPADPSQSGRDDRHFFQSHILPSFRRTYDVIREAVAGGQRPSVLFRSSMAGAAAAVEAFGLVGGCVYLQPSAIVSRMRPAWPLTPFVGGRFGEVGRRVALPALMGLAGLLNPFSGPTNAFRRSLGLAPVPPLSLPPATFHLMLCPDWFAMPQRDWPDRCFVTGFVLPPADAVLPPAIARFIERRGAPLVFTPGTGVSDVGAFVARARQTASALGYPALVLTPHAPDLENTDIMTAGFVDLATLLPASRALVHHGGIGTVAQALAAGVPQLVVAGRFDQPDNAVRVAQLGLGGAMLRRNATAEMWTSVLAKLLASGHIRQQVATAAELVRRADGAAAAEAVLACHEAAGPPVSAARVAADLEETVLWG